MKLKKFFSNTQKTKEEKVLKDYDTRRNSTMSSTTLSLGQSISNWTHHKEKERTKSSYNSNKRYSHPSPPISTTSTSSLPPQTPTTTVSTARNSVQVTQKERQKLRQQRHSYYSNHHNPFVTTATNNNNNITPPTPSDSMRDVVNTLRNSMSSDISTTMNHSPSFSTSSSHSLDSNHHHHFHHSVSDTIPVAAIKEEEEEESPAKRQIQVFYPPPNKYNSDSNKYEVFEDDFYDRQESPPVHSVLVNTNNATGSSTKMEIAPTEGSEDNEANLYSELLSVSLQLDTINPNNATEIKTRLKGVNDLLGKALTNSGHLQSKIATIVESSKSTIMAINEENKALKETEEQLKLEIQQLQDSHKADAAKNQDVYEGLVQEIQMLREHFDTLSIEHEQLQKEYQTRVIEHDGLKEMHQDTQLQLNQLSASRNSVVQLFKEGEEDELGDDQLQEKIKTMMAAIASSQVLIKEKQVEIGALKEEIQQLTLKTEGHAKLLEEKDSQYTEEKSNLESRSRDLAEERDRLMTQIHILETGTTEDVTRIAQENMQLQEKYEKDSGDWKISLESTKQENNELHTKFKEAQDQLASLAAAAESSKALVEENEKLKQQMMDMERASKEAAQQVMNENEQLEQRLQEMYDTTSTLEISQRPLVTENEALKEQLATMQQENKHLSDLVDNLQHQITELSKEKQQPALKKTLSVVKRKEEQQEELMRMHTKAQLGLIEYLEGEKDVVQAMATLKRQLEDRM